MKQQEEPKQIAQFTTLGVELLEGRLLYDPQ
jgi:hypothetical protein